jgi:hypothetical protein
MGHPNCYYAPANASLFYARNNGAIDLKKALAMLMMAKAMSRTVNLEFISDAVQSDFWGYGVTRCEIQWLILN